MFFTTWRRVYRCQLKKNIYILYIYIIFNNNDLGYLIPTCALLRDAC